MAPFSLLARFGKTKIQNQGINACEPMRGPDLCPPLPSRESMSANFVDSALRRSQIQGEL